MIGPRPFPAGAVAFSVVVLASGCGPRAVHPGAATDPLVEDPPFSEATTRTDLVPVVVEGDGPTLLGLAFVASGPGLHPMVVMLHGFPGNETNHDLARVIQRAGWNVLFFHYRGSWGSRGHYTFGGALEDVGRVIRFLRDPRTTERLRGDPGRIVLVGHSFGGFLALKAAAEDPEILGAGSIAGFDMGAHATAMRRDEDLRAGTVVAFRGSLAPLQAATSDGLVEEMARHESEWALAASVPELADRPILLVAALHDEIAPPDTHHRPLALRFRAAGGRLTENVLRADHDFSSARVALSRLLLAWLSDLDPSNRREGR